MASLSFRVRPGVGRGVRVSLLAEGGEVRADVQRRARNVRDAARANLRERSAEPSGRIGRSIRFATRATPDGAAAQVGSDLEEALWVEEGTGVYGPRRRRIVPRRATFMRFRPRGGAAFVYARSVRGQPGKHYLRDAADAARR